MMTQTHKYALEFLSLSLLVLLPINSQATSTAPYLEVTYTVQIPVTEMEDMVASTNLGSWNTIRSYSSGVLRGDAFQLAGTGSASSNINEFSRSFYTIDTSSIPDTAVIQDASLVMYVDYKDDNINNAYSYVALIQGSPASSTNVTGADYDNCGTLNSPTLGSATYDITSVATGSYKGFDLNSTGLSWISKTGYTTLCMRDGHDIENQSYSGSGSWLQNLLGFVK